MPDWEQVGRRGWKLGTVAEAPPRTRFAALLLALLVATGCASPGPPRAPSLQLPAAVSNLVATRRAGEVELSFAVPERTSDGVAYRGATVRATVCRAVETGTCVPVPALTGVTLPVAPNAPPPGSGRGAGAGSGGASSASLQDVLPASLMSGPVRLLTYRVELANGNGRTAGFGDAAYAAAGAAPIPVTGLRAEGSRDGVVLRWQPGPAAGGYGDVVLRRELVAAASGAAPEKQATAAPVSTPRGSGQGSAQKKGEGGVIWLSTAPQPDPLRENVGTDAPPQDGRSYAPERALTSAGRNATVDDSAHVGSTYRYAAERQRTAQLGGHTLVLHSARSAPVEVALRAVYPPPAPTDLVGTVFPLAPVDDPASVGSHGAGLAVDLIWTPAEDPQTTGAKIVGYNVYREVVGGGDAGGRSRTKLTSQPVRLPAFHDVLDLLNVPDAGGARAGAAAAKLRYSVTAVDANGLESPSVITVVDPTGR